LDRIAIGQLLAAHVILAIAALVLNRELDRIV
jgi:hypothetical protein